MTPSDTLYGVFDATPPASHGDARLSRKATSHMLKKVLATGAMLAMAAATAHAQAPIVVYNNTTTLVSGLTNGGATSATGFTDLVANKITTGLGGQTVTSFGFSLYNGNTVSVSFAPTISFYATNGTGGGPGTILQGYSFGSISVAPNTVSYTYNYTPTGGAFIIPTSGTFWMSETFSSSTATLAQLNAVGEGLFSPPSVGSTSDLLFETNSPGQYFSSNPAGTQYSSPFGGNPPAEIGFTVTATPEPSQYAAFGLGILGVGALALKARRRSVIA